MKLYFGRASCSLAPHILLHEIGKPFDSEQVDLRNKTTKSGKDFREISPKGYVPLLQLDNGEILSEAAVILQYLADQSPEKNLAPKIGTMDRYRFLEWLNYIATELHKGFGPLWNAEMPEAVKEMTRQKLLTRLGFVDAHLAGRTYLMGDQYTAADAYLFTVTSWAGFLKFDISQFKNLAAYMSRMNERPGTLEALKAEGLLRPNK